MPFEDMAIDDGAVSPINFDLPQKVARTGMKS